MTKRAFAALLLIAVAMPLSADFSEVARAIDRHKGVSRVWIPFLGVARTLVRVIEPEGVYDFQLVTFKGADHLDPSELRGIVESKMGPGFMPLVRAWSKRSGEWSFIYAKPSRDGSRVELMVLAHDDEDTVLVRVDVNAEILARELDEPRKMHRIARR